jgi:L-alanine-DL-glutamate epimerase-like enolase superfamily enzyme
VAPFLRGKNPLETERIWNQLFKQFNPRAQTGMWSSAVSAIDIALWDIKGKHYKEPVWRLLGGAQNPVASYVTFGLKQYTRDQLVEVAEQVVAQGEKRLKMVVAADPENPKVDADRVQAVRKAIGDDVELMIDANYLFSFNRALELCKLVEPYHITWFEEPVYQNDAALLADLRRHTNIPIAAGQNDGHRFRHRELIVNHAVYIAPNVCSVGGYTEAVKSPRWRRRSICRSPTAADGRITTCTCKRPWPTAGASSSISRCGASATKFTKSRRPRTTAG